MNKSYIIKRLKNGEFNKISEREFGFILQDDELRELFKESLSTHEITMDNMLNNFKYDLRYLRDNYWDVYEVISFINLTLSKKYVFDKYLIYILGGNVFSREVVKVREMMDADKKMYRERINELLIASNYEDIYIPLIDDEEAVRFIMDNKLEYLYNCIDYAKFKASFFKDLSFLKMIYWKCKFVRSSFNDLDMIMYILNNHEECPISSNNISFKKSGYTKEEISKFVDSFEKLVDSYPEEPDIKEMLEDVDLWDEYMSNQPASLSMMSGKIDSKAIATYIVRNKKTKLYKYIDVNVLDLEDFKTYINTAEINNTIHNFNIMKYLVDVKEDDEEKIYLDFVDLSIEQFEEIKDKLIAKKDCFAFFTIRDREKVKYIINNNLEDWYQYVDLNEYSKAYFQEEDIVNIVQYLKYKCFKEREYIEPWKYFEENLWKRIMEYIIFNEEELLNEFSASFQVDEVDFNKKNITRLIELFNRRIIYGPSIIKYLAKKDKKEVDKFIEIIKYRALSENEAKTFLDAFQQTVFRSKYKDVVNIFVTLKGMAEDKSISYEEKKLFVKKMVLELRDYIPKYLVDELSRKNINYAIADKKSLLLETLLSKVVNGHATSRELDILHEITDYYVADKGNKYSLNHGIDRIMDLEYNYDIEDNKRIVDKDLFNFLRKNYSRLLLKIVKENGFDKDSVEGSNIKVAKKIFVEWYEKELRKTKSILPKELQFLFRDEGFTKSLKKELLYKRRDISVRNIASFFTDNELDVLFDSVIKDNKVYQKLLEIVSHYKFLEWSTLFGDVIEELYGETGYDFYTYINAFATIFKLSNSEYIKKEYKRIIEEKYEEYKTETDKEISFEEYEKEHRDKVVRTLYGKWKATPNSILKDNFIFNSHSIVYKLLLGEENYRLIKSNKKPNEAHKEHDETLLQFDQRRLEKTTRWHFKSLELTTCTVPSFTDIILLPNGKKIRVIVGNRTSPILTTLGERTDSCMRAGGVGEGLFDFCLDDERGLHILFADPNTGEFVSRISGFRNGNTLFLNQLRHAIGVKYNDEDLVWALKYSSKKIIDISQKSEKKEEIPLDNVIADYEKALKKEEKVKPSFKKYDVTIPNYSDVGDRDIVILATTSPDGEFVPFKEKRTKQHKYNAVRLYPRRYFKPSEQADNELKRIYALQICYSNSADPYYFKRIVEDIPIPKYKCLIVADDWAVILKDDWEIEKINVSKDKRSIRELNRAVLDLLKVKRNIAMEKGELNDGRETKKSG